MFKGCCFMYKIRYGMWFSSRFDLVYIVLGGKVQICFGIELLKQEIRKLEK